MEPLRLEHKFCHNARPKTPNYLVSIIYINIKPISMLFRHLVRQSSSSRNQNRFHASKPIFVLLLPDTSDSKHFFRQTTDFFTYIGIIFRCLQFRCKNMRARCRRMHWNRNSKTLTFKHSLCSSFISWFWLKYLARTTNFNSTWLLHQLRTHLFVLSPFKLRTMIVEKFIKRLVRLLSSKI